MGQRKLLHGTNMRLRRGIICKKEHQRSVSRRRGEIWMDTLHGRRRRGQLLRRDDRGSFRATLFGFAPSLRDGDVVGAADPGFSSAMRTSPWAILVFSLPGEEENPAAGRGFSDPRSPKARDLGHPPRVSPFTLGCSRVLPDGRGERPGGRGGVRAFPPFAKCAKDGAPSLCAPSIFQPGLLFLRRAGFQPDLRRLVEAAQRLESR